MFIDWGILSSRQIIRMADAELVTEIVLACKEGVVSSSPNKLRDIYKNNEKAFDTADDFTRKIDSVFDFVTANLVTIRSSNMMKSYVFLSLVTALVHNRWGVPGLEASTRLVPIGRFAGNLEQATEALIDLATAHETRDMSRYPKYVAACTEGANRETQRRIRVEYIAKALRNELPAFIA